MREVHFKNKNAKHGVYIQGKRIEFVNGKAFVTEEEAKIIEDMADEDYKVIPLESVESVKLENTKEVKSKSKPKKKSKKSKT